ncbi:MAG: hypothetical protein Kow0029_25100 [Candidatus Rifleibacteriota bacterium]
MKVLRVQKIFLFFTIFISLNSCFAQSRTICGIKSLKDSKEVENILRHSPPQPLQRRIEFFSRYLLGRKYHPETKNRIRKQKSKKAKKVEANNEKPLDIEFLGTSMQFLDCMTYVEHVLALANCKTASYEEFLNRLIDIMFDANGKKLQNHLRNHFTSHWADVNERKGYLANIARKHSLAKVRYLFLNRVKGNRTFYVEDRFMISKEPQQLWYFPREVILNKKFVPDSGDVIAMVTEKEGLDVTHMAFYITHRKMSILRHASYRLNKIVDQDFYDYLKGADHVAGLMVLRPVQQRKELPLYDFRLVK